MDFLTKLSILGRFSIKNSANKIVVKQRNYIGALMGLIVISFFIFLIIIQIYYKGVETLAVRDAKSLIGIIVLPVFFYFIIRKIIALLKPQTLTIDRSLQKIIYNNLELAINKIDYADLGKNVGLKGYRYYLVFYLNTKEGIEETIFLPTFYTKRFMIFLANETNRLTAKKKIIRNQIEIHDFLSIFWLLFIVSIFLFLAYLIIFKFLPHI